MWAKILSNAARRQASRQRAVLCGLLGLAALAAAGLTGNARAQGLVQGVMGTALSPAPGQPPASRLRGGVALRLEFVQLDGQRWQHLLGSDGSHGWTTRPVVEERPVTARALGSGFELMPLPPGHRDFLSSVGQPVPDGALGRLLGGSRDSQVSDAQDLLVPAWLTSSVAPWPRWAMAGVEGYAPLSLVALAWPAPAPARAPGAALADANQLLGGLGLDGLTRAPFLAEMAQSLRRLAPMDGARALDLSDAPGKAARRVVLRGEWQGPQCSYRAASAPAGGLSALLCFAQGKARAFVLQGTSGASLIAHAAEDSLSVARVEESDLDGDGLPEWLLEMVGVYGDGYYSELWVVDGRSGQGALRIQRQALSRGSGESPEKAQDAAWGIGSNHTVWMWRSTARGSRLSLLRYSRGALSAAASRTPALVLLGSDESWVAARQRQLQAVASVPGAVLLPRQTPAGPRWFSAMLAANPAQARRWAAERALPTSSVQTLPWSP